MLRRAGRWGAAALVAALLVGCGDDGAGSPDAAGGPDTGDAVLADVPTGDTAADVAPDVAPDTAVDVPGPGLDVAADAVPDAAPDVVVDAIPDATPDVGEDAEPDAAPDVVEDAVPDAEPDAIEDASPDAAEDVAPDVAEDAAPDTDDGFPWPGDRPTGQCVSGADCPSGMCNTSAPGGLCQGCSLDGCPSFDYTCNFDTCNRDCSADTDCPVGLTCLSSAGVCVVPHCDVDADCEGPFVCNGTLCNRPACGPEGACPAPLTCDGGLCVEP